ncbi:Mg/Co/Ni transporter MgtE (contains CBS domain) [Pseudonocardia thermophila]|jgi:Mg/Co/Ni transporter MgtE (contains CBS domain)|uniref:Mg/Co/Ni transporter MgtE (Contains CBS domain) n=1 Tax=Pseudonocardia thermophila TaxID=1848 RepID=A0A1M6WD68_PSETH|nr:CBS domain-containing protein [Pseudonocardia thermophila]SHK91617.1 Mg/Co/Ni transporter MgtE (contains CBS domain) [Pseudonocardia thermophila]
MGGERLFVAPMVGLPIVGPDGERIGKVRDLVASLRVDTQPPRVLGLVCELATRRRIFIPMLRVAAIDPSAVTLTTGSVSLRGFVQRPNETLVVGQLIDARVQLAESGEQVVVVDAAIEQTRTRDWIVGRLAVRARRHGLARRGQVQVVHWSAVSGLTLTDRQGTAGLLAVFETMRPADVAAALSELPQKRQFEIIDALDDERLADVFEELSETDQRQLIAHLDPQRAADVLEAMSPDDAADLLGELPDAEREHLLGRMAPTESAPLRRLLSYSSDTAGGLMTPEPIILRPDATVAEALAHVRNPDIPPALASMVFVCRPPTETPTGRYLGCVHTQRLLREAPFDLVAGIVDTDLARLSPDATLAEITRYFATYNLVAGPVVDAEEHLLGAVTVDDVLDHLLPDDWRDQLPEDDDATGELDIREITAALEDPTR